MVGRALTALILWYCSDSSAIGLWANWRQISFLIPTQIDCQVPCSVLQIREAPGNGAELWLSCLLHLERCFCKGWKFTQIFALCVPSAEFSYRQAPGLKMNRGLFLADFPSSAWPISKGWSFAQRTSKWINLAKLGWDHASLGNLAPWIEEQDGWAVALGI